MLIVFLPQLVSMARSESATPHRVSVGFERRVVRVELTADQQLAGTRAGAVARALMRAERLLRHELLRLRQHPPLTTPPPLASYRPGRSRTGLWVTLKFAFMFPSQPAMGPRPGPQSKAGSRLEVCKVAKAQAPRHRASTRPAIGRPRLCRRACLGGTVSSSLGPIHGPASGRQVPAAGQRRRRQCVGRDWPRRTHAPPGLGPEVVSDGRVGDRLPPPPGTVRPAPG